MSVYHVDWIHVAGRKNDGVWRSGYRQHKSVRTRNGCWQHQEQRIDFD